MAALLLALDSGECTNPAWSFRSSSRLFSTASFLRDSFLCMAACGTGKHAPEAWSALEEGDISASALLQSSSIHASTNHLMTIIVLITAHCAHNIIRSLTNRRNSD